MKVETIEAHQLHVVSQWYVHPLLSKSLYKVGSITVVVEVPITSTVELLESHDIQGRSDQYD
jgi:hypothetical protein